MKTMAAIKAPAARPLSPHLQIYKPTLTMTMSIVHRITGIGNYFGTLLLAWWFIAAASPSSYAKFEWFAGSIIGRIILFGYTWSVIHHMLGGIRHLIWDTRALWGRSRVQCPRSSGGCRRACDGSRSRYSRTGSAGRSRSRRTIENGHRRWDLPPRRTTKPATACRNNWQSR